MTRLTYAARQNESIQFAPTNVASTRWTWKTLRLRLASEAAQYNAQKVFTIYSTMNQFQWFLFFALFPGHKASECNYSIAIYSPQCTHSTSHAKRKRYRGDWFSFSLFILSLVLVFWGLCITQHLHISGFLLGFTSTHIPWSSAADESISIKPISSLDLVMHEIPDFLLSVQISTPIFLRACFLLSLSLSTQMNCQFYSIQMSGHFIRCVDF